MQIKFKKYISLTIIIVPKVKENYNTYVQTVRKCGVPDVLKKQTTAI